jgi:DNA-binding CsgD family transcriptional regulator
MGAAARSDNDFWLVHASRVSGLLELSLGRPEAAVERLYPLVRRLTNAGGRWTEAWDALPITVEALVSAGELTAAAEVLELLETRNWLSDSAWRRALIDRCRGLVSSAQGDHEAGLAALTSAMEHHGRDTTPFEQARTLLTLGTLQRRTKLRRAARSSLEASLATFERLGARVWADNARAELRRIGGRSPAGDALTRTERQVAELVANGMSNKVTAARLSLTAKTIEANLTRIYAKLGVHSRTELAVLIARDDRTAEVTNRPTAG